MCKKNSEVIKKIACAKDSLRTAKVKSHPTEFKVRWHCLFPQTISHTFCSAATTLSGVLFACQSRKTLIQTDTTTELQRKPHWVSAGKDKHQQRYNGSTEVQDMCGHSCVGNNINIMSQCLRTSGGGHTHRKDRGKGPVWKWMGERQTEA